MPSPRPRGAPNPPSPNPLDNWQLLLSPPAASVPDPKLKEPVSQINKVYYDLVFTIKARGDLEAIAIQRLYLTEFLAAIRRVDESAVLLPFKSYFALNEEVLSEPDKIGQSYMAVSKYFQGFHSQRISDRMYISVLVAYNCTPEDFHKNLHPDMENLGHYVYTCSVQAPFLSKIGWLFHSHEHMDLRGLTEFLEKLVRRLNPEGPPIAFGLQFKNIWDGYKTPKATPLPTAGVPSATPLVQPKCQAVQAIHV